MKEIYFVDSQKPDHDAKQVKRHIRKAVLRCRVTWSLDKKIKHFDGDRFVLMKPTPNSSAEPQPSSQPKPSQRTSSHDNSLEQPTKEVPHGIAADGYMAARRSILGSPDAHISSLHPYPAYAAACVKMPVDTIDNLFRSRECYPTVRFA